MKIKNTSLAILLGLVSYSASAKDYVITDGDRVIQKGDWQISNKNISPDAPPFTIGNVILKGGKQEGSELLTIKSEGLTINLSPTRGLGIVNVEGNGIRLGWDSPVKEIVNPKYMNLESRGGAGWLDGFNEMMVRCGFEWTGHAVQADGMMYTLHGRAQNTPVSKLFVEVEEQAPYTITIRGLIKENAFKKSNFETWVTIRHVPGSKEFTVHDILTNLSDYDRDYQIIYHSNFGTPILEQGAKFVAPVKEISPFNEYAATGLKNWQTYQGPTKGFDEMVYNIFPYSDANNQTQVMLKSNASDKGVGIAFNTQQLPVLTLWKNTDTLKQGYVTGIEPGTSFAYPVTIEREQKRVPQLGAGKSTEFILTYSLLSNKEEVANYEAKIKAIQGNKQTKVVEEPMAKE
ncbi:aldose 1-epimerase family protein [Gilliamella sp. B14384H2]|uniref:aldose 1-epimerase family protein n=1 Tax=unclassified Gilliamella TaxID=2685620 RepID=UPI0018DD118E|nr:MULTISPECIES: aldose 1-epimerase family protein [unclassified Gilliamella]MBI0037875.1 aldose 1-epimerase family protein [Gilliamella sp. B14384G10]MBI0039870.1 aldose 1-epimerase family protein [Gilliamella sp. B14384G7]MBI0051710.1 aldose 1-epimerase family protein [Gilliamella sp. B14384G13]MBI0054162.1 aldose 1-epimerase family protein [Gilliamella sp. B14384H2]